MPTVRIQKLESTDAFIVFDLDGAPHNIGITRLAPKILADGATLLARSNTYLFATFEQQAGGASAGINAKPEDRDAAIAAFVTEVGPLVAEGTFLTEPGKGVSAADLAPLLEADPRAALPAADGARLLGAGVATAVELALGGSGSLAGARVAVEGLDRATVSVVTDLASAGGQIVAVSTTKGTIADPAGLDPAALAEAVAAHGPAAVEQLGPEVGPAWKIFGADADVLCAGSKSGAVSDAGAGSVTAKVVAPIAPVPVTAKALAMLRRQGSIVLPDFVTIAGPMFASFPDEGATFDDVRATVVEQVGGALGEVLDHEDGPLLGACYRAEAFLRTWCDALPFGRPLA
jgi:glutamate dehydrogenase (NAD(P)+)